MEAPIITYVGEISEPALRGILTSYSGIFVSVGFLFEYTLGNFVDWRTAALISAMVPVITLIAISQVSWTQYTRTAKFQDIEGELIRMSSKYQKQCQLRPPQAARESNESFIGWALRFELCLLNLWLTVKQENSALNNGNCYELCVNNIIQPMLRLNQINVTKLSAAATISRSHCLSGYWRRTARVDSMRSTLCLSLCRSQQLR